MMKTIVLHLRQLDWVLIVAVLLLVGLGFLSLYSSSLGKEDFSNFQKQIAFFGIGVILMFVFSFIDWRIFRDSNLIVGLYILSLLALAGLFFFAPEIRGVKGWYRLGPVSLDPIEFVKLILIILLAKYFSSRHIEIHRIRHIFLSGLYVLVPSLLIFRQPDLGSVLVLAGLWLGILIASGISLRHLILLVIVGVLIFALAWGFLLKDYQKERLISFILPGEDPLGASWSQNQARIAIGSGGLLGQGIGRGGQTQYGFLPEPQTDFIFSAIAEEMGLVGAFVLLLLFLVIIWRIIKVALLSQKNFARLFATGLSVLLVFQLFIHIGMNLGLMPVIGISLPFISYGGSNLVATFIGLGIIQSIKISQ